LSKPEPVNQTNQRWQLDRNTVLRKPVRATFLGWHQGYDLEVDPPQHNFLLASVLCCSNSHSAAYALVAYQTAWLKAHYRPEFMAAVLSSDMDNTDKIVILIAECADMKLTVCSPNINISNYQFTVNEADEIVYGIGAIKGVGEAAIEDLLKERKANGAFTGLYDLCKRVDLRKVNRRVFEALIRGGAFDTFNENRASHMAELPTALKVAERHVKMAAVGQNDLFGLAVNAESRDDEIKDYADKVPPWSEKERLAFEKLALGLFLTGHPIDQYKRELSNIVSGDLASSLATIEKSRGKIEIRLAGILVGVRTRQDRKGQLMGFATLDDKTSRMDVTIYSEKFAVYKDLLAADEVLLIEATAQLNSYSGMLSIIAEKIYTIEQARETLARCLAVDWNSSRTQFKTHDFIEQLQNTLEPFSGGQCMLMMNYQNASNKASIQLGDAWRIHPTDELILRLQRMLGDDDAVQIKYR
ncbi:MAG: DNA polymerase III subunit alpha, partial [Methyloprofundus sp.]|nr:DNA polymerase III subunit alpha [Methyloprofundus sp.]